MSKMLKHKKEELCVIHEYFACEFHINEWTRSLYILTSFQHFKAFLYHLLLMVIKFCFHSKLCLAVWVHLL